MPLVRRCEYKAYYNLVSQERRGIEKRAKKFEVTRKVMVDDQVVEKTIVIEVDQAAMWRVEQHKVRGLVSLTMVSFSSTQGHIENSRKA